MSVNASMRRCRRIACSTSAGQAERSVPRMKSPSSVPARPASSSGASRKCARWFIGATLYRIVQAQLEKFCAQVDAPIGTGLPLFVKDRFGAFRSSSILAHGFLHMLQERWIEPVNTSKAVGCTRPIVRGASRAGLHNGGAPKPAPGDGDRSAHQFKLHQFNGMLIAVGVRLVWHVACD